MALADILDFVQTTLEDITGMGLVHTHQPVATKPGQIPATFGESGAVHFWSVRRESTTENRLTNRETERHHTLVLRGQYEVADPEITEPLFQSLIEAVMLAFREEYRIGPAMAPVAELFGPAQLDQVGWRVLGQTLLVHYCEMRLTAQELIRRAA